MAGSVLSRYLDPDVLSRMANRAIEPRGLVMGNLAGAHRSPLHGFAVEFAGHREYNWGDDPKHIDWRVYFTREKYFIKQYEMETNLTCHLVLDVSASMRYGAGDAQKMFYAAKMVTCLGHAVVRQSDRVSLFTFDRDLCAFIAPSNTMAQVLRMTEHLDEIEPVEKTRIAKCLAEVAGRIGRREIVMVFSDFFVDLDELESVLQRMRYQQHEVVLFQTLHGDEISFEFDGMVKFVGLEEAGALLAQLSDVRGAYLEAFERFDRRFAEICQRNRVERVVVDTRRDLAAVLVDYLNQRSVRQRRR